MVRLWVDGEDYGKMTRADAENRKRTLQRGGETGLIRIEDVPDDAPDFLPGPSPE